MRFEEKQMFILHKLWYRVLFLVYDLSRFAIIHFMLDGFALNGFSKEDRKRPQRPTLVAFIQDVRSCQAFWQKLDYSSQTAAKDTWFWVMHKILYLKSNKNFTKLANKFLNIFLNWKTQIKTVALNFMENWNVIENVHSKPTIWRWNSHNMCEFFTWRGE